MREQNSAAVRMEAGCCVPHTECLLYAQFSPLLLYIMDVIMMRLDYFDWSGPPVKESCRIFLAIMQSFSSAGTLHFHTWFPLQAEQFVCEALR